MVSVAWYTMVVLIEENERQGAVQRSLPIP